ncbi:DNA topoisomerase 2-like protein [Tanacetum coccineum]
MPTDPPPETYEQTLWIWQDDQMKKKEITFVQRLYSIFDEVLVNAANNTMNHVKVNMDVSRSLIIVWNNVDPTLFDIDDDVFLGKPSIDDLLNMTVKHDDSLYYRLVFFLSEPDMIEPDMIKTEPGIWTVVSFKLDIAKFGMKYLEDTVALMKRRVVDLAGCLKDVKVELDGTHVQLKTFEDYAKLYLGTSTNYLRFFLIFMMNTLYSYLVF